jgi:hypothetical protein
MIGLRSQPTIIRALRMKVILVDARLRTRSGQIDVPKAGRRKP